jgi:hypothetical protein
MSMGKMPTIEVRSVRVKEERKKERKKESNNKETERKCIFVYLKTMMEIVSGKQGWHTKCIVASQSTPDWRCDQSNPAKSITSRESVRYKLKMFFFLKNGFLQTFNCRENSS